MFDGLGIWGNAMRDSKYGHFWAGALVASIAVFSMHALDAHSAKREGGHPEVSLFGKYEDKLVKTPDGWRIKERVWSADSFRGSALPVTPSPVPGDRRTDSTGGEANKDSE